MPDPTPTCPHCCDCGIRIQDLIDRIAELETGNREFHEHWDKVTGVSGPLQAADSITQLQQENQALRERVEALTEALATIASYAGKNGCCPYGCDTPHIALQAIKQIEGKQSQPQADRADDGEAVTREWIEQRGFISDSGTRDQLRYRLNCAVSIVSFACVGGWGEFELWCVNHHQAHIRKGITRGDVRNLCKALGVSLTEPGEG